MQAKEGRCPFLTHTDYHTVDGADFSGLASSLSSEKCQKHDDIPKKDMSISAYNPEALGLSLASVTTTEHQF